MKIVDSNEVQWHSGPGHRGDGIFMRDLLLGEPGPDNYWLVLTRVEGAYDTPLHSHAFEQVRVMLEGTFNFGAQDQEEGTIGYFCEGTPYEQQATGASLMLLLQCEGPSHTRYTHVQELYRGAHELRAAGGRFEDGIYTAPDGTTKDGYDAIWEHVTKQEVPRPPARFSAPVIMRPDAFDYVPISGTCGVYEKRMGSFNERQLGLSFLKLDDGAKFTWSGEAFGKTLFFVMRGTGSVRNIADLEAEDIPVSHHFAIACDALDDIQIVSGDEGMELLAMQLPR